jgi:hypothetical protein
MIPMNLQSIIFSVLILGLPLNANSCGKALNAGRAQSQNERVPAMSSEQSLRVQHAADRFIERFRETLNFGVVFDEMFVDDAIQRLRKAKFFRGMHIDRRLEKLDDLVLTRTYKAFMNYYYLKAVYDLGVRKGQDPPPEVTTVIRTSKFSDLLSDEGSGDSPVVTTQQDLDQFVADLDKIAASYKKHLPPDFFKTRTYKENLKLINKPEDTFPRIHDGHETLGVAKGTKVYEIEQDVFTFFFIDKNGELKVLALGLGN